MRADCQLAHTLQIPGHVHKQRYLILQRLDITDIQHPHALRAVVESLTELLEHQEGAGSAEPQVVVGATPVGGMVIDAVAATATLFGIGGEMADVAIVVIGPEKRDIVGHLQAGVVGVKDFLVGDEDLRLARHLLIDVLGQHIALRLEDLREGHLLSLHGGDALHRTVVDATHAERIDLRHAGRFLDTLLPKAQHLGAVGVPVVVALAAQCPFAGDIAAQRLAMAGADEDAVLCGKLTAAVGEEEGMRARVHRRPIEVGAQTQEKFEDAARGLRAHLPAGCGLVVGGRPGCEAPVLVVDEDSAIGDIRRLTSDKTLRQHQLLLGLGVHVGPPLPGRHAQLAREFHDAIGGAIDIAAGNDEGAVGGHLHDESLALSIKPREIQVGLLQPLSTFTLPRANDNLGM